MGHEEVNNNTHSVFRTDKMQHFPNVLHSFLSAVIIGRCPLSRSLATAAFLVLFRAKRWGRWVSSPRWTNCLRAVHAFPLKNYFETWSRKMRILGFGGQHLSSRLNYTADSVTVKRNVRRFLELCRKVNKDSHYITGIHLFFLHVCSIIWTCVFAKSSFSCSLVRRPQM